MPGRRDESLRGLTPRTYDLSSLEGVGPGRKRYQISEYKGALKIKEPWRLFADDPKTGDSEEIGRFATEAEAKAAQAKEEDAEERGRGTRLPEEEAKAPEARQMTDAERRADREREAQRMEEQDRREEQAQRMKRRNDAEAVYNRKLREIKAMDIPAEQKAALRAEARRPFREVLEDLTGRPSGRQLPPTFAYIFGKSGKGKLKKPKKG